MELTNVSAFTQGIPAAVITVVIGALTCFFGYRLRKVWVAVMGFCVGFLLGYGVANLVTTQTWAALIGLIVALALMLAGVWMYNVGIFILCGGCGAIVTGSLLSAAEFNWPWYVWLIILLAVFIVVGCLSLKFLKPVLIVASSFSGASSIVSGVTSLGLSSLSGPAGAACMLVVAVIGAVVQFATTKGK